MGISLGSLGRKARHHAAELALFAVIAAALVGVDLMFYFWPFRYREVHPMLQQVFRSRVDVEKFHRTYFPHPGFVAEGMTLYRYGDTSIPPLATVKRMQLIGTWTALLFHPHVLYEIRLEGLHVRIPPRGTRARKVDFSQGMTSSSQSKMEVETIVADGTTLDFLRGKEQPPMRFQFAALQIHDVLQTKPLLFTMRVAIPGPGGTVFANGSLGPMQTNHYASTHLAGTFSLAQSDLSHVGRIAGHVAARGHFSGTLSAVDVLGQAAIPDFRAGSAHMVRLDAGYHVTVNGTRGDVKIDNAVVRSGDAVILASGSVSGSPKKVALTIATDNSQVADVLRIIEKSDPQVEGAVTFRANAEFTPGPQPFLQRLNLKGTISLKQVRLTKPQSEQAMDRFSARVRRNTPPDAKSDPPQVTADASSDTLFANGIAHFPDIRVTFPGVRGRLHGTFNLLSTRIHLTGQVALQQGISHAATGWKAIVLKPLTPFFRHKRAAAVVAVAVTGTAQHPKVGGDLLHDK